MLEIKGTYQTAYSMAYKNADAIKFAIGCTVNILEELKPICNFKVN